MKNVDHKTYQNGVWGFLQYVLLKSELTDIHKNKVPGSKYTTKFLWVIYEITMGFTLEVTLCNLSFIKKCHKLK